MHANNMRKQNAATLLLGHLKRVHVNARMQKWMLDELKKQGEVGIVLEYILERKAGFKYQPEIP